MSAKPEPMNMGARHVAYEQQNHGGSPTARQRRRIRHKTGRAVTFHARRIAREQNVGPTEARRVAEATVGMQVKKALRLRDVA